MAEETPKQDETDTIEELHVNGSAESKSKPVSKHKMTASLQMIGSHAVEGSLLKQLWFGKIIVKFPFVLFATILLILGAIVYVDSFYFDISDNSDRTYLVEGNKYVDAFDAYNLAGQFIADNLIANINTTVLPQTQEETYMIYQIMFTLRGYKNDFDVNNAENTDYWILTPENIETIIKYEDMIVKDQEWINRFCYVGSDPLNTNYSCTPAIQSAARIIYNLPQFGNMSTADIKSFITPMMSAMSFFFNPGAEETGQTYIYRSFLGSGLPIATEWSTVNRTTIHKTKYGNAQDRSTEQELEYIAWASHMFKEVTVKHNGDLTDGNLKILAVSWPVYSDYFNILLNESMIYLTFSVIIVLFYMTIHLNSIFLSFLSLIQILMSFPLAYFFYRLVLGIPHYDTLSSLIIFVLLGVGADDVFVFTDAWSQSTHFIEASGLSTIHKPDCRDKCCCSCCIDANEEKLIMRMSFTFRRAAKAMLVTQMTTFFAFLATATSRIMPISGFGVWAATIIAMNYLLVITLYPATLIVHHRYIKKYEAACLCCICNLFKKKKQELASLSELQSKKDAKDGIDTTTIPDLQRQLSQDVPHINEYRCFEMFLGRKWAKWMINFKKPILFIFFCVFIAGCIVSSNIEAESTSPAWFPDEHFMQKAQDEAEQFSASETDSLVQMRISLGIKGVDREGFSRWDPTSYGSVVWDSNFAAAIVLPESQAYLLEICQLIRNSSLPYAPRLVTCPIEQFKQYVLSMDETFPYEAIDANMASFGSIYNDFMKSELSQSATQSALTFVDPTEDDYEVRFYAMFIYASVTWSDDSFTSREYRSKWDKLIADFSANCPQGLCDSVGNIALRWCWLETQKEFVRSAVQGIFIAMPLAFVVLLASTLNWIISIFAVLDIIGIMLCELSIMYFMGWKFGVSESVAIVIIIGFSVDYVVHLANAYLESAAQKREERLSFALLTMGISVVSGAVTTFGAGFFLIFPAITFFFKMGVLMISTVAMAIIWAMVFFTSICALIGPEENSGDLRKICECCASTKKQDVDERKETYQDYEIEANQVKPYQYQVELETR